MIRFHYQEKLIPPISFFFILFTAFPVYSLKNGRPLQTISATLQFTGDLKGDVQFGGELGSELLGVTSNLSLPCTFKAYFRPVFYQRKRNVETILSFACPSKQQGADIFSPPRFFIDANAASSEFDFVSLSANFKKIHLLITELKITQKQVK